MTLLRVEGLSKHFGGVNAVEDLDFDPAAGDGAILVEHVGDLRDERCQLRVRALREVADDRVGSALLIDTILAVKLCPDIP